MFQIKKLIGNLSEMTIYIKRKDGERQRAEA
jgi:hypothetical protein